MEQGLVRGMATATAMATVTVTVTVPMVLKRRNQISLGIKSCLHNYLLKQAIRRVYKIKSFKKDPLLGCSIKIALRFINSCGYFACCILFFYRIKVKCFDGK